MTTILQLSDTHIAAEGQLLGGKLDTTAALENAIEYIQRLIPKIEPLDGILITGDLSEDGSENSYQLFKALLQPLQAPLFIIPGNHDNRETLRNSFDDQYLPKSGRLNWHSQLSDVDLIGLDTLVDNSGSGILDDSTQDFLRSALDTAALRPVLLALHHPPFDSGIKFMDNIGLKNKESLGTILQDYSNEIRVICGHIHNTIITTVGSKVALSAPSPCSNFALDLREDAPVGFMDAGDGFLLHQWNGAFQSVRIGLHAGAGPFPFVS